MLPAKFGRVSFDNGRAVYEDNNGNLISEDEWYQANGAQSPLSLFKPNRSVDAAAPQTNLNAMALAAPIPGGAQNFWGAPSQAGMKQIGAATPSSGGAQNSWGAPSQYGAIPPSSLYGTYGDFAARQNDFIRRYQAQAMQRQQGAPQTNTWNRAETTGGFGASGGGWSQPTGQQQQQYQRQQANRAYGEDERGFNRRGW